MPCENRKNVYQASLVNPRFGPLYPYLCRQTDKYLSLLWLRMESDSIERYDRQIRLWGQHGQNRCSNSKICLINANSLGTEILKGLCLVGIGSFTILDSHKLTPEDVGCQFIPHSCIGKSRGESVRKMLLDLNDEVSGEVHPLETYLPHIPQSNLECETVGDFTHDLGFWKQFNCIIASGFLYIDQITRLSKLCWTINVPLILCKSIGFLGSMRSQIREHLIVETHPDNVLPDFNIDKPFHDLKQYFDSIELEDDSNLDKINSYPYIVIVYKYLEKWQHDNKFPRDRLPNSYSEKKVLRAMIDEGLKQICRRRRVQRTEQAESQTDISNQEMPFENYIEASKSLNSCLSTSGKLPESVLAIFSHPKVSDVNAQNLSRFWVVIKAIREFVLRKNDGRLPVSGSIPDMTSSSEEYIRLQTIYSKKAREDLDAVFGLVQNFISSINCSFGGSLYDDTKLICKNIRDLQLVNTCPIYEEFDFKTCTMREEDEEDEFITIGLCLKSLDLFFSTYGRLPGCQDNQVETDINKLKDCVKLIVGKTSNRLKTLDQWLYELCRYGGAQLHATSAFLGGCIAQEVIKLITNQYVPVDNTLVYNGMAALTKSFKFSDTFIGA